MLPASPCPGSSSPQPGTWPITTRRRPPCPPAVSSQISFAGYRHGSPASSVQAATLSFIHRSLHFFHLRPGSIFPRSQRRTYFTLQPSFYFIAAAAFRNYALQNQHPAFHRVGSRGWVVPHRRNATMTSISDLHASMNPPPAKTAEEQKEEEYKQNLNQHLM